MSYCVFCNIIQGREPATVLYEDSDVMVFRNLLDWLPVMLLAVPKRHLAQEELWSDAGAVGRAALAMGRRHCPNGFRLVSNFGPDAMQSQPHAHIHVLGGGSMDAVAGMDGAAVPETLIERGGYRIAVSRPGVPPILMAGEPLVEMAQDALWQDIGPLGAELVRLGQEQCPIERDPRHWFARGGFRLVSNFGWDALQTRLGAHLYLLGGGYLDHYV